MSRHESDREELLREATALVERAELTVPGEAEPIVVGFRRDGAASFFFGADPVYQFNAAGELRRAYVSGLLYKAERGRLVSLQRERSESATHLVRGEISLEATAEFLLAVHQRLTRLQEAIGSGSVVVIGQVPVAGNLLTRISDWLAKLPTQLSIARVPNVVSSSHQGGPVEREH
jgi:hypothetical protein